MDNIFTSTQNWKFTAQDHMAETRFQDLQESTRKSLPASFYSVKTLTHLPEVQATRLYHLLKTIPKGALHHIHGPCCDDPEYYRQFFLTDNRFYLSHDLEQFHLGSRTEAQQKGWVSMGEGIEKYGKEKWLQKIMSLVSFTQDEYHNFKPTQTWTLFQKKILLPLEVIYTTDLYEQHMRNLMTKFKHNGYQRVEVRQKLKSLNLYGSDGTSLGETQFRYMIDLITQVAEEISQGHSEEFFGYIEAVFKYTPPEQNEMEFKKVCSQNWKLMVGFDFVNQEDKFKGLEHYDPILQKVLDQNPHLTHLKKAYHAGQTINPKNKNVEAAVKAGSVRLGHGFNILQRIDFLPHCKHVCFQNNPLSNLILGYNNDLRQGAAPLLLGLGYPVSISPDDPGKFGYEDSTYDYFIASTSFNWTLRHLKLVAYHSINHALCSQRIKSQLIKTFEEAWDKWILSFLQEQKVDLSAVKDNEEVSPMFSSNLHWSFSKEEAKAEAKFQAEEENILAQTTESMFSDDCHSLLAKVQGSELFRTVASMPKGVLHSCHLHYCHDLNFFHYCQFGDLPVWISPKQQQILGVEEKPEGQWFSLGEFSRNRTAQEVASSLFAMTTLSLKDLQDVQTETQFWRLLGQKKSNLLPILIQEPIFKQYVKFVLRKLSRQGYQRVQFRIEPLRLVSADKQLSFQAYFNVIEEAYAEIKKQGEDFSIGLIVCGNKDKSKEDNRKLLQEVCSIKSKLLVGFDFDQGLPEDNYPPISTFDQLLEEVLEEHEDCMARKLYQVGSTRDHLNRNIDIALRSGASRVANSINILQQTEIIPRCRKICLEVNPIFQFFSRAGGRNDFRLSVGTILLGLGIPVSVGWDYGGLLGLVDSCSDLSLMVICSNWSLKHLKLTFLHSIQHAAASEGEKTRIGRIFDEKWNQWVSSYVSL